MEDLLLDRALRYAEAHADRDGVARTPVPGLTIVRDTLPTPLQYAVSRPLVALVQQGRKQVSMGNSTFDLGTGASLLITADVPTVSQITQASAGKPHVSVVIEIDQASVAWPILSAMRAFPGSHGNVAGCLTRRRRAI